MAAYKNRRFEHLGLLLCLLLPLLICPCGSTQERFESGELKGFLKERPELQKIGIPDAFHVRAVKGVVFYMEGMPLADVAFEIRDGSGRVLTTKTDSAGNFEILGVPSGAYSFKVTKNGFHSTIGQVIVSRKASKGKQIRIQLAAGT